MIKCHQLNSFKWNGSKFTVRIGSDWTDLNDLFNIPMILVIRQIRMRLKKENEKKTQFVDRLMFIKMGQFKTK